MVTARSAAKVLISLLFPYMAFISVPYHVDQHSNFSKLIRNVKTPNTIEELVSQYFDEGDYARLEARDHLKDKLEASFDPAWIRRLHEEPCEAFGTSQYSQDCLLDAIFQNIGVTNRFFVEYGFDSNEHCSGGGGSNTCQLRRNGWDGILFDDNNENPAINLYNYKLNSHNIAEVLTAHHVPHQLDLLSSDMDSHDWFVLRAILDSPYQPRVVITEYNRNWPLDFTISQMEPWMSTFVESGKFYDCLFGASASAIRILMEGHDYSLVGVVENDLFWVKSDELRRMEVPEFDYFVDKMKIGDPIHNKVGVEYLDLLIDVSVFHGTNDLEEAKIVAIRSIHNMIIDNTPIRPVPACLDQIDKGQMNQYLEKREMEHQEKRRLTLSR